MCNAAVASDKSCHQTRAILWFLCLDLKSASSYIIQLPSEHQQSASTLYIFLLICIGLLGNSTGPYIACLKYSSACKIHWVQMIFKSSLALNCCLLVFLVMPSCIFHLLLRKVFIPQWFVSILDVCTFQHHVTKNHPVLLHTIVLAQSSCVLSLKN